MKYINMKNLLIFQKLIYFGQIKSDIFHFTDMLGISKLLRTPTGPLLYQFQSNPNQTRGPNPVFSPPNFTKSEITFFSFCAGFQALSIFFIWLKSRRNPLTEPLHNSCNRIQASGQVWDVKTNFFDFLDFCLVFPLLDETP